MSERSRLSIRSAMATKAAAIGVVDAGGRLELERSELGGPDMSPDEDILLNVTVEVSGYTAADQSWVPATDWLRFVRELAELDQQRQGRAVLEGASTTDLHLDFHSTDSAGHMAVRGHLGGYRPDGELIQLRFGFSFEPDQLPLFLRNIAVL